MKCVLEVVSTSDPDDSVVHTGNTFGEAAIEMLQCIQAGGSGEWAMGIYMPGLAELALAVADGETEGAYTHYDMGGEGFQMSFRFVEEGVLA
jgi:hypothetical protein